jgi:hypothetical protein
MPIAVKFTLDVKTPNTLNGAMGTTAGARMGADSLRRKQRGLAYMFAIRHLEAVGSPTGRKWIAAKVRKGVVVREGYHRSVILLPTTRWSVEMVRFSAGRLDGHDGLRAALKSVVDGIADALDVNDGDLARVAWVYGQRKTPPARKATAFKPARAAVNQVEVLISEVP